MSTGHTVAGTRPTFSVVVTDARGPEELARCVAAVRPQCDRAGAALIVVPGAPGRPLALRRADGLAGVTSDWVAMTEPPCVPDADWLDRLIGAAEPGDAILGGAVGNARRESATARAAFFAEYGIYGGTGAGRQRDGTPHIAAASAAYHRSVVPFVVASYAAGLSEPSIHSGLCAMGWPVRMVPTARVRFDVDAPFGAAWRDRFDHGRDYAAARSRLHAFPARIPRAVASLLALPLLAWRIGRAAEAESRGDFARSLPLTLVLLGGWSVGECVGWLTGRPA